MKYMKNKCIAILLCVVLTDLCLAQSKDQKQTVENARTLPAAKLQRIEAAIAAWMTQTKAPALSIAVVTENQMRLSKGYGLADVENSVPAKADTAYRLASITKSITAVAVMQLVERGKLDLSAPINKYCAAYPEKQTLKDAPDKQFSITVRQLLVHQSGVRHNKPDEVLTTRHYNRISEAIGSFKDDPLVVEPETKYSYSTPGYTLLGCAIETASGMSYTDYLRENIFKPAGMTRTVVDDVYAIIPNRARGYRKTLAGEIQNAPLHDTSIKIPGGGLVTTVEDLAKFAIAINTNQLVKTETLAQMWTKPKSRDGKEQAYAMGFLINDQDGLLRVLNDGSQAGTRTYLFLVPKHKFAVALMTNLERASCEELVPKIIEAIGEK
jgi:CubicO group peptidase (beta-lactamase class C family)